MKIDWRPLDDALERRAPVIWWRDDDAVAPGPALDRLLALAGDIGAPMMLASIPVLATEALAQRLSSEDTVSVAVHGYRHTSHAPATEKKAEFGAHRAIDEMQQEIQLSKQRIDSLFGRQALPVFVPPWNRMDPKLAPCLAETGFRVLSQFAQRGVQVEPLLRLDAHLDPIDWRGTRSAIDGNRLVRDCARLLESGAPVGLMTHHLVHDEAIWTLTSMLARRLTERGATWVSMPWLMHEYGTGDWEISSLG